MKKFLVVLSLFSIMSFGFAPVNAHQVHHGSMGHNKQQPVHRFEKPMPKHSHYKQVHVYSHYNSNCHNYHRYHNYHYSSTGSLAVGAVVGGIIGAVVGSSI